MNKKNAFSYVIWFLYSIVVCAALLGAAGVLSKRAGYPDMIGYGVGGVWLILCGLIVFFIHKLTDNLSGRNDEKRMPALVAESLIAVILFGVGFFLRIKGISTAGEDAAYYELAKVAEGQSIPAVVHGAVYFYLQLLHLVYLIFGNNFIAGVWLQIVLYMIASFILYRGIRKMAGVLSSVITLGFLLLAPTTIEESLSLSPEILFMAVFAIGVYCCAGCINGRKGPVVCIMTGLLIGVVCYLDVIGVVLALIAFIGILSNRNEGDCVFSERIIGTLCCMISCVAGFALMILADTIVSGKAFVGVLNAWWNLYAPTVFSLENVINIYHADVEMLFVILIMGIGIFSFWCNNEREGLRIWVCSAGALFALQAFGVTTDEVNGFLYLYIIFVILAAVGFSSMFGLNDGDEEFQALGRLIDAEDEETVVVRKQITEPVEEKVVVEEATKVKFLENPLPLPKKHVKKVLDYDIEPKAGQEDFDLVVDDNDDYDI